MSRARIPGSYLRRAAVARQCEGVEALESRQMMSSLLGLTRDNILLGFDSATPATIQHAVLIQGLTPGERITAIDTRGDSDTDLYGLGIAGTSGRLYRIDAQRGLATQVGQPFAFNTSGVTGFGMAFTPQGLLVTSNQANVNYPNALWLNPETAQVTRSIWSPAGTSRNLPADIAWDDPTQRIVGITTGHDVLLDYSAFALGFLPPGAGAGLELPDLGDEPVGLDQLATPSGATLFASLRVEGRYSLYSIEEEAWLAGTIGDGSVAIQSIAALPSHRAPILNTSLDLVLPSIQEDSEPGYGTSISDLIGSASARGVELISHSGRGRGIAITLASPQGIGSTGWQFSSDAGAHWTELTGASERGALLLTDASANRIRFVPEPNFAGNASLRFRGWDQSTGSNGTFVDVSAHGGQTAFSSQTESIVLSVLGAYDAPAVRAPAAMSAGREDEAVQVFRRVELIYPDGGESERMVTISARANTVGSGRFTPASLARTGFEEQPDGSARFVGSVEDARWSLARLRFDPADGLAGTGREVAISFSASMKDSAGGTGVNQEPITLRVLGVNSVPTIVNGAAEQRVNDNGTLRPFSSISLSDPDPGEQLTVTVKLKKPRDGVFTSQSLRSAGFAKLSKGVYRFTASIASAQSGLRALVFDPRNVRGPLGKIISARFEIHLSDGLTTATDRTPLVLVVNA